MVEGAGEYQYFQWEQQPSDCVAPHFRLHRPASDGFGEKKPLRGVGAQPTVRLFFSFLSQRHTCSLRLRLRIHTPSHSSSLNIFRAW